MATIKGKLYLVGVVALVALVAAITWFLVADSDDTVGSSDDDSGAPARMSGTSSVDIALRVHMPPSFDDGVPDRRIRGVGRVDWDSQVALVDYGMGKVPNSAGYFGHVEGDLTALYRGSEFLVTFPVMAKALPGGLEWLSYQLEDFSDPDVVTLGIGQLREIGLADPRLMPTLMAINESESGSVVLAEAAELVAPEFRSVVEELMSLGLETVKVEAEIGPNGDLVGFSYKLSYPPEPSSPNARLSVSVDLGESSEAIEEPSADLIQPYREFLGF